jgi:hypothetical protein
MNQKKLPKKTNIKTLHFIIERKGFQNIHKKVNLIDIRLQQILVVQEICKKLKKLI